MPSINDEARMPNDEGMTKPAGDECRYCAASVFWGAQAASLSRRAACPATWLLIVPG
jgi:hypothetical protein